VKRVMGLINLNEDSGAIRNLADFRAVESIPFAGRYRLIDFALSGIVNAGILNVGVMLPEKERSILDHLRSGKDWDLARRHDGLYYLPAAKVEKEARQGDLKNFYFNLDYIHRCKQTFVLLTGGSFVYNMDFKEVLAFHEQKGADITMVYYTAREAALGKDIVIKTTNDGLVTDISERPETKDNAKVCMSVFLMEKSIFENLVTTAYERGGQDFMMDCIIRRGEQYNMYAMEHKGYVAHIDTELAYYRANMDILRPEIWEELFMGDHSIYTKVLDGVPVQYKKDSVVKNSLIANGCVIEGEVENSVLFRGVKVGKGAKVKNSIIMQKSVIEDGALIENVICDKNAVVSKDKWLKGAPKYPYIIEKNMTI